jgi:hypothetical protein
MRENLVPPKRQAGLCRTLAGIVCVVSDAGRCGVERLACRLWRPRAAQCGMPASTRFPFSSSHAGARTRTAGAGSHACAKGPQRLARRSERAAMNAARCDAERAQCGHCSRRHASRTSGRGVKLVGGEAYPRLFFFGITNMLGVDSCVFLIFTTRVGLKTRLNGVKSICFEQSRKF